MGASWYRCPGIIDNSRNPEIIGKPLSGCWLNLGIHFNRKGKGGEIYCAHCGGRMMESVRGSIGDAPHGVMGLEACLKDMDVEDVTLKGYDIACCYNHECSERYLDDGARGSKAERQGKRVHSGTQFIWKADPTVKDTWAFGDDLEEGEEGVLDIHNENSGKSWRRCVFCASLLKMHKKPSKARTIYMNQTEKDKSWDWAGPAMTFRVYRKVEYDAFVMAKGEREPVKV